MASSQSRTRASASAIAAALRPWHPSHFSLVCMARAASRASSAESSAVTAWSWSRPAALSRSAMSSSASARAPRNSPSPSYRLPGPFPAAYTVIAGGAERGGGADQAAERVRVESGAAGAAEYGGDSLGQLAEVGQLARPRE